MSPPLHLSTKEVALLLPCGTTVVVRECDFKTGAEFHCSDDHCSWALRLRHGIGYYDVRGYEHPDG